MPEGHTLHRLARAQTAMFVGRTVSASSLQERFVDGAARLDGRRLDRAWAYGKHLFHRYDGLAETLHVHLGLYGKFAGGALPPPEPRGALRLRLVADDGWMDLRGPTACELLAPDEVDGILERLGPDPLARRPDPQPAWDRLRRTRVALAAALMDQRVLAGVGNVYRAELLYRHRRDPWRPSRELTEGEWLAMWDDLVTLMRAGVRSGRIVTTLPGDRERPGGRVRRDDAHYVYRRTGLPCRVCGTPVRTAELVGRHLYWCEVCQVR